MDRKELLKEKGNTKTSAKINILLYDVTKNLKKLIDSNKIEHSKVKKHSNIMKKGRGSRVSSSIFKSQQTNKSYTIFHEVICSSAYVI